ncbi:MAG: fatty acid desaturase, partial [Pseudomonadota bacterium]
MSVRRQSWIGVALAILFIAAWLALHVGAIFGLTVTVETAGIAAALVLVQAWLSTALFITAHDAMHGAVAPRWPRLQQALGRCALMIYAGIDFARMAPAHFDHHKYAGTAGDPDFNARDPR